MLSSEWNAELSSIGHKFVQHQRASKDYLDQGVKLLELAQHAVIVHRNSNAEEKRRILKIVHSNSFWRDGELTANYQKPFDLLAVTNKSYKRKKANFPEKSGLRDIWLPGGNAQQNFFTYKFAFFMSPIKKNHPRTEYSFQRVHRLQLSR